MEVEEPGLNAIENHMGGDEVPDHVAAGVSEGFETFHFLVRQFVAGQIVRFRRVCGRGGVRSAERGEKGEVGQDEYAEKRGARTRHNWFWRNSQHSLWPDDYDRKIEWHVMVREAGIEPASPKRALDP